MCSLVHFWRPTLELNQVRKRWEFVHLRLDMYSLVHIWQRTTKTKTNKKKMELHIIWFSFGGINLTGPENKNNVWLAYFLADTRKQKQEIRIKNFVHLHLGI